MDDKVIVGPTLEQLQALEDRINDLVERARVFNVIMNSGAAPDCPAPDQRVVSSLK